LEKILLATNNLIKVGEIKSILAETDLELLDLTHYPGLPVPAEPDPTYAGNALIKAHHYAVLTGLPALADDSGLEVDALDNRPGVLSARYGGEGLTSAQQIALLLEELGDRSDRGGRFMCVAALVYPDGRELVEEGSVSGQITREPSGGGGFGYDPIFFLPEEVMTMAEVPAEMKNLISHRACAFRAIAERIA